MSSSQRTSEQRCGDGCPGCPKCWSDSSDTEREQRPLKPTSETNGGIRLTCENCGHEPCADWCGAHPTSKPLVIRSDDSESLKAHVTAGGYIYMLQAYRDICISPEEARQLRDWLTSVLPDETADELGPGEEWCMSVAGVMVKLDEWEPGAFKRRTDVASDG